MSGTFKVKEIGALESKIKLLGISKDGKTDIDSKDSNQNIDDNTTKLIFSQTPHIVEIGKRFSNELGRLEYISCEYDKFKLFDLPGDDRIITFATSKDTDNEQIVKTVSEHFLNPNTEKHQNYTDEPMKEVSSSSSSNGDSVRNDNALQNFILNYIEYMKEFTIASIQMNEKTLRSFWKKFNA
jgi:hypothetical protein